MGPAQYLSQLDAQIEAQWRELLATKQVQQEGDVSQRIDASKIMVHKENDIHRDLRESMHALAHVIKLRITLEGGPKASELRQELLAAPQIQQVLRRRSNGTVTEAPGIRPRPLDLA